MTRLEILRQKREEIDKEIEKLERDVTVNDPIYLLSAEEYVKYKDRIPQWNRSWWLRTPAHYPTYAGYIHGGVLLDYTGDIVDNKYGCVRPVLNESNMRGNTKWDISDIDDDRISYCGIIWIRLDEGFWIAETPIATRRFDEKSNEYNKSEVRQFLLDWYEERKGW